MMKAFGIFIESLLKLFLSESIGFVWKV
jgi:hypothetical protein